MQNVRKHCEMMMMMMCEGVGVVFLLSGSAVNIGAGVIPANRRGIFRREPGPTQFSGSAFS